MDGRHLEIIELVTRHRNHTGSGNKEGDFIGLRVIALIEKTQINRRKKISTVATLYTHHLLLELRRTPLRR